MAKLNIDENPEVPGRYGVRGIPTMLLFKDGQPVAQKLGAAPRSQIQQWLEAQLDSLHRVRPGVSDLIRRVGAVDPARVRPELVMAGKIVPRFEPADPAAQKM